MVAAVVCWGLVLMGTVVVGCAVDGVSDVGVVDVGTVVSMEVIAEVTAGEVSAALVIAVVMASDVAKVVGGVAAILVVIWVLVGSTEEVDATVDSSGILLVAASEVAVDGNALDETGSSAVVRVV